MYSYCLSLVVILKTLLHTLYKFSVLVFMVLFGYTKVFYTVKHFLANLTSIFDLKVSAVINFTSPASSVGRA